MEPILRLPARKLTTVKKLRGLSLLDLTARVVAMGLTATKRDPEMLMEIRKEAPTSGVIEPDLGSDMIFLPRWGMTSTFWGLVQGFPRTLQNPGVQRALSRFHHTMREFDSKGGNNGYDLVARGWHQNMVTYAGCPGTMTPALFASDMPAHSVEFDHKSFCYYMSATGKNEVRMVEEGVELFTGKTKVVCTFRSPVVTIGRIIIVAEHRYLPVTLQVAPEQYQHRLLRVNGKETRPFATSATRLLRVCRGMTLDGAGAIFEDSTGRLHLEDMGELLRPFGLVRPMERDHSVQASGLTEPTA